MTEEKENCNFQQNYNVFGLDDKPCCYLYHKYCEEIDNCYFKRCKRLEQENKELKKLRCKFKEYCTCDTEKYRSALEEIRKECKCYGRQRGSNREFDREYGGELHINIIEQINEVLNHSED